MIIDLTVAFTILLDNLESQVQTAPCLRSGTLPQRRCGGRFTCLPLSPCAVHAIYCSHLIGLLHVFHVTGSHAQPGRNTDTDPKGKKTDSTLWRLPRTAHRWLARGTHQLQDPTRPSSPPLAGGEHKRYIRLIDSEEGLHHQ
jgi:hypothetical protein